MMHLERNPVIGWTVLSANAPDHPRCGNMALFSQRPNVDGRNRLLLLQLLVNLDSVMPQDLTELRYRSEEDE